MHTEPYTSLRTNCVPKTYTYTIRLDRVISKVSEWQEELETLALAKEGDTVVFHICTDGGNADTMKVFLHEMAKSPAHLHAVLAGSASSAGSFLALACDTIEVGQFATMFIHSVQTGYSGSADDMIGFSKHIDEDSRNIVETSYRGFLSEEEIEQVNMGREFFFRSEEIISRLEARKALAEEEVEVLNTSDLEEMSKWSKERLLAFMFDEAYDDEAWEQDPDEVLPSTKEERELIALKTLADNNNIKYAHNIGYDKLYEKLKHLLDD